MFGNTSSPFGQKSATPGTTGGFGQQPAFGTASSSTGTFGTSQQPAFPSATPAFGQTSTFGQTAAAPSFGNPTTQPSFGTSTTTPAFGAPTSAPTFGATTTAPAFGAPTSTPAFGVPTSTPAFGAPTSTPAFGTPTSTPAFGNTALSFGTTQQKTGFGTPQSSVSFGVGNTQPSLTATTAQTGFGFTSSVGQPGFGASTTTTSVLATSTAATPSVNFNPPQTTSVGFNISKAPTLSFGTPTTATQSSLTFGTSLTPKSVTSTALTSSGFTFGTGTTTQAASTTQGLSSGVGLSGLYYSSTAIGGKSMLTITGNTATPLYGTKSSDLNASKSQGHVPPKCQAVHPLVLEMVESFKNHIKDQKHLCLEVSRASLKPINKISSDAENVKKSVMKLERAVNKNKMLNSKLKEETVKALADVEIAQKAMDYPGGFPCDNSIVTDYFLQLANKFQAQVVALRIELENTEKSIMCELNPAAFTPQELSTTMQRLYECFVALAGRFQFVHAQISNLKVQHLELRKRKLEDYTDIFSKKNFSMKATNEAVSLTMGPSPFSGFRNYHSMNMNSSSQQQNETLPSLSATAMAHSFLNSSLNKSALHNTALLASPSSSAPGSKRGKR
ncbi:nuclear pore complex protein Nup58 isoform X1 [Halyomorpha halys]|uniref:nuclear pore complex protein Nup58 isoform X1 n=1 Tax=Halyomorpha halys TaxID=286706 RepID=UPI0006D4FA5D|nr:probable nucleoporin Nup58 [Halyomorpha halys]